MEALYYHPCIHKAVIVCTFVGVPTASGSPRQLRFPMEDFIQPRYCNTIFSFGARRHERVIPPHSNHRLPGVFFMILAPSGPPPSSAPTAAEAAPAKEVLYDRIMSSRSASSLSIFFRFFFGFTVLVLAFFSVLSGAPSALPFGAAAAEGAAAAASSASRLARFFSRCSAPRPFFLSPPPSAPSAASPSSPSPLRSFLFFSLCSILCLILLAFFCARFSACCRDLTLFSTWGWQIDRERRDQCQRQDL